MAEKRKKSILSSLKNVLHRDPEKPSDSGPKTSGSPRKKSTAPAAEDKRTPETPPADARAPQDAPDAKPEKKKAQNQPWYRHRQRW